MEGTFNGSRIRFYLGNNFLADNTPVFPYYSISPANAAADNVRCRAFSKTISLDGKIYTLEMLDSGWKLSLTQYTGPVALVKLNISKPANGAQVTLASLDDTQTREADSKDSTAFIPGEYRLKGVHYAIYDDKGGHQCVSAEGDPAQQPIKLAEGENTLNIGGPFKLDFTASFDGETLKFTKAVAIGVSGERYGASASNENGQMLMALLKIDGKEQELTKLEYG
jgi:hypothetical protein